jgi:hypothetical protein
VLDQLKDAQCRAEAQVKDAQTLARDQLKAASDRELKA